MCAAAATCNHWRLLVVLFTVACVRCVVRVAFERALGKYEAACQLMALEADELLDDDFAKARKGRSGGGSKASSEAGAGAGGGAGAGESGGRAPVGTFQAVFALCWRIGREAGMTSAILQAAGMPCCTKPAELESTRQWAVLPPVSRAGVVLVPPCAVTDRQVLPFSCAGRAPMVVEPCWLQCKQQQSPMQGQPAAWRKVQRQRA